MKQWATILLVALPATACVTVRPLAAPSDFLSRKNPEVVWAHHHDGEVVPVYRPSMRGDTLVGTILGTQEPVRAHLPSLRVISARQSDHRRTALLLTSIGLVAGFVTYRALQSHGGPRANCFFDGHENVWTCN